MYVAFQAFADGWSCFYFYPDPGIHDNLTPLFLLNLIYQDVYIVTF